MNNNKLIIINFYNNYILIKYINKIKKCWKLYNSRYTLKLLWCKKPLFNNSIITLNNTKNKLIISNKLEKIFGNNILQSKNNNQWTTLLSEYLFKQFMNKNGINIWRPQKKNCYKPDWESNDCIYEIKCRNWTTFGTAGDKVYGIPFKYSDIPRLYEKPLQIICMAYQEYELFNSKNSLFNKQLSNEKKLMIEFWKKMNIEIIPFTKFIKMI